MAREEVVPRGARCQVVVIGDRGTGKSSLIIAVATDSFPDKAPPVLPPTRLPHDFYPDRVPLTIVDTSSRLAGCILLLLPAARMLFLGGTSLGRGFWQIWGKNKNRDSFFPPRFDNICTSVQLEAAPTYVPQAAAQFHLLYHFGIFPLCRNFCKGIWDRTVYWWFEVVVVAQARGQNEVGDGGQEGWCYSADLFVWSGTNTWSAFNLLVARASTLRSELPLFSELLDAIASGIS
jgi:GTPase SAR1 family protein